MSQFKNINLTIVFVTLCVYLKSHICDAFRLELASGSTKCIAEEIKRDAMTVGKYQVINPYDDAKYVPASHLITARVTSPRGNHYHYKDGVESGTFAFTAMETGDYITCFWVPHFDPPTIIELDFEWMTGMDAKNWYNVARKGQFDLLDVELKRLHDTVKSIHNEMFYLREREDEMQILNTETESKMAQFGLFSIILILSVAVLQLWHLKGYFEREKLL